MRTVNGQQSFVAYECKGCICWPNCEKRSTSPTLTTPVSEAATGSASQPGGSRRAGVHTPVGYDAVYAESAPGPSRVVLRHGGEVCVILSFVFLQGMCATCTKQAESKVAYIESKVASVMHLCLSRSCQHARASLADVVRSKSC